LRGRYALTRDRADLEEALDRIRRTVVRLPATSPHLSMVVQNYVSVSAVLLAHDGRPAGAEKDWPYALDQGELLRQLRTGEDPDTVLDRTWRRWSRLTAGSEQAAVPPRARATVFDDDEDVPATVRLHTGRTGPVLLDLPGPLSSLVRRIRDSAKPDPAAALGLWRAVFGHPLFLEVDVAMRRTLLLWGATTAFVHYSEEPGLTRLDAWLDILRRLAELVEPDHPWWTAVAVDVARVTAMRHSYTADAHDLDVAFDRLAVVAEARNPGDAQRLECLELLGGLLGHYGDAVRGTAAYQQRVRRLDLLLRTLPPAQDGVRWAPVRLAVLRGYAAEVVDRDRQRDNVLRSLEIAEHGLAALRLDGQETNSWTQMVEMLRERVAMSAADDPGERRYDVGAAMARAGDRTDPAAARERVQILRMAVPRVSPADRHTWFGVRAALAVDLMRLLSGSRGANIDEAIAVAEEMADEVTAADPETLRTLPATILGELYEIRVNGDPAENAERMLEHHRRRVELADPGSPAWVRGAAQMVWALIRRVRGERAANLEAALELAGRVLAAARSLDRADLRADANYALGLAHRSRLVGDRSANAEQAIAAFIACLADRTEADGDRWANAHHNLAAAYLARVRGDRQENLGRAIHHLEQELRFFDRDGWPDDWALAQITLGDAHIQSLRPSPRESRQRAVAAYEAAVQVLSPDDHPAQWSRVHNSLGLALMDGDNLGDRPRDPQRALECLEEALRTAPRGLPDRGHVLLNTTGALTLLARRQDDADERRALLERALATAAEAVAVLDRAAEPIAWARAQSGTAQCALDLADLGVDTYVLTARDALRDALDVFRENGLLSETWAAAVGLVLLNRAGGQWAQAVEAYHVAAEAHEVLYRTALLQDARAAVLARGRQLIEAAVPALLASGDPIAAVVAVERVRARWLGEALARDRIDLDRLGREHPPLRAAYTAAVQALASAEALERRAAVVGEGSVAGAVEDARQAFTEVLARIQRAAGFGRFLALPDFDDVGAAVRAEAPLVYVVPTEETCHLLVVHRRAGGQVGVRTAEAPALTRDRVDALLLDPTHGDASYLEHQLLGSSHLAAALATVLPELGRLLVPPLRGVLDDLGATGVTLVPTGRLALLPIHAAPHPDTGTCLLDDLDVTYLPSAWARERVHDEERRAATTLVAVGDPTEDLPYARMEAEEIADVFGATSVLHRGAAATADAVVADLPGADYVHLACHGYHDVDSPLDSHLRLACGERLTLRTLLDGRMFAAVRLVVASACQTAVGEFRDLPDEAIGLPAGFLRAGAAAVIGTLWPVDDLSTALLMMRFYRLHLGVGEAAGMPPARALRIAQRWLSTVTARELGRLFGHPKARVALGRG
jgi:tetratricopeptide (TPR) repeat protein